MQRDRHLETCGSVCVHQRDVSVHRKRAVQLHDCFQAKKKREKDRVGYAVIIKQRRAHGSFQVQIEAKVSFSWPSHQIHEGRPPEQITPFKQHRRKQFIQEASISHLILRR